MNTITPAIYEGFQPLRQDLAGWSGADPIFTVLISEVRPKHIIEIGTWKGLSAITMAKVAKRLGLETRITCVDTWLGSLEFWTDLKETPERDLMLRHGYPQIYFQFLSNVVHEGLEDIILPFPTTSFIAARCLRAEGITAQLIYIDGNHEYEDVIRDCVEYWALLDPGGILFGHDWGWNSVRRAVNKFAKQMKISVERNGAEFWLFRKVAL